MVTRSDISTHSVSEAILKRIVIKFGSKIDEHRAPVEARRPFLKKLRFYSWNVFCTKTYPKMSQICQCRHLFCSKIVSKTIPTISKMFATISHRFGTEIGTIWGAFWATLGVQVGSWRGLLAAFLTGCVPTGPRDSCSTILFNFRQVWAPFRKGFGTVLDGSATQVTKS